MKTLFEALKGTHLLQKPQGYHKILIEKASEEKDNQTVIDAYCDILDYGNSELTLQNIKQVFAALSYTENIDHHLFSHLSN